MTKPGPRATAPRFKVGDRVLHKSNPMNNVARCRAGVVTQVMYKKNSRGHKQPFVEIKFDHSQRPEIFMSIRVMHETKD
tara:strand:+ start:1977 stop:2213 length:237 start_codon:yes stop_codon:yes gene_type:complete